MPDISMCKNGKCSKRNSCYRYNAIPDPYWQAYGNFEDDLLDGGCKFYYEQFTKS